MPEHVRVAKLITQTATDERPVHRAAQRRDLQRFIERRHMAYEYRAIRGLRPPMPQIMRDGLGCSAR